MNAVIDAPIKENITGYTEKIKMLMRRPQIADYRNNFDFDTAKSLGFEIKSLGRKG